jgi:hypothetical protein
LPRWGVVATVDEPLPLIAAFVAHHHAVGADEIHLFFDRPNPQAEALVAQVAGVHVHHSGEDGWARAWQAKRPPRIEARQKYNATRVLDESGLDWVVHCDADEFVTLERPLEWELARVPPEKGWLKLEVDERAYVTRQPGQHIFEGVFRRRWPDFKHAGELLYGARARFLNKGLTGHVAGKACVRAGRGYAMGVHFCLKTWDETQNVVPYRPSYNARLQHYDGLTPLHYVLKMLRRASTVVAGDPIPYSGPRSAQFIAAEAIAGDARALSDLWWDVLGVSAEEMAALEECAALSQGGSAIAEEVAALFPQVDLSPRAFDLALLGHEADLIRAARDRWGFDPAPLLSASSA